ncbi:MAG: HAMP domain-containing histidine kinase [Chloroflexi bacterium]|nr:HAMP domain-containing histidine kinase [Chloroflexota bacterium]MCC6892313.1 HAMP domain-containing histidine kinase [Anaerolineae bacterium]
MSNLSSQSTSDLLDRKLAEADSLKYTDYEGMLTAAREASALAQNLGDYYRYAQALTHKAWAYGNLNQYAASLLSSLEVMALARNYGYVEIEARAVGIVSLNFMRCGMSHEATYLYEHQYHLGKQLNDPQLQAMALNDWALIEMNDKQYDKAIVMLRQAAELMSADTHHGSDRGCVHHNLSLAYIDVQQWDEAIANARQMIALETGAPRLISDAHVCMGTIFLRQGQPEAAKIEIDLARAAAASANPPIYNDNIEQLEAELLVHEGRDREAVVVWEGMYTLALERRELDYAVEALHQIKTAYERLNDSAGLISIYKRLSEEIPRLQKQFHDLRFNVLRMVFAMDKAAMQAELHLSHQKTAILNRLSHEFRTPLAIIQNSAYMVEKYSDRLRLEQRQAHLQGITAQINWLTVMLDDILELLKLDEHPDKLAPLERIDLNNMAQAALTSLARYHLSDARVMLTIQPDAPSPIGAYEPLMTIIVHLLTNAIKFSEDEVRLALAIEGHELVIKVSDQGIGIREDEHEAVFQALVRGSNLDEVTGNGLGLAIVRKWVEQLHGRVLLESAEGHGTTVTVRVPVTLADE